LVVAGGSGWLGGGEPTGYHYHTLRKLRKSETRFGPRRSV
jgi:hypothetical protein